MSEHVLQAFGIGVGGRPRPLLPPTDLELWSGEVRALVGEPGHAHAALALVLAGRLRPDAGDVVLNGVHDERRRQAAVALVDVPGVSEPDEKVPFGVILGEELALAGRPARRSAVRAWAPDIALGRRTEDTPADRRTELLMRAATLRPKVRFLVLTLPDRWGVTPAAWQPVAAEIAEQGFGVLVTVGETSRHLLSVPATTIGDAQ
ncbi:MAG: hypothetical protein QM572_04475 [Nocardioides sp.]|uniref:hypothetical protein n=1 Tax=Nocardioides sp. TaxID=35761 RepID=UPI0039E61B30